MTIQIYAHRGLSGRFPENTQVAFQEALAIGVDGIEFDVHATSDGVPVIIHDRSLERTTDGAGYVDEVPLSRLKKLDAGGGESVPTLEEVLTLVGDRAHLDIEVKQPGIEEAVLSVLGAHPETRWAISSFDWDTLRTLHALDADAELWPLTEHWSDEVIEVAQELGSPVVALLADAFTAASAAALCSAGLSVMVWKVNTNDEARRVAELGASALCTDYADRIIPVMRIANGNVPNA